ncbi:MAG: hypothetical protein NTZ09_15435 [Candidatus Hydrogenedentes bacterium]|nr:hypothetical protein [Candidatus Hydrogenedentota bacterium]
MNNAMARMRSAYLLALAFVRRHFAGMGTVASYVLNPLWTLLLLGLSVYLAATLHKAFLLGCLLIFPLQWLLGFGRLWRRHSSVLENIRKQWLTPADSDVDFEWLYEEYSSWTSENDTGVDDLSWDELELERVFSRANRTFTTLGEIALYSIMRTPLFQTASLQKRMQFINLLQNDQGIREAVQVELSRLGKARGFRFNALDSVSQSPGSYLRITSILLLSLTVLCLILIIPFPNSTVLAIAVTLLLVNLVFSAWFRWLLFWRVSTFVYLGGCVACAMRLARLDIDDLRPYTDRLGELSALTKEVCRKSRMLEREESTSSELPELLVQYARSFFLLDVSDYFRLIALARQHRASIRELLGILGDLDAMQSIVSFRKRLPVYCEPAFSVGDGLFLECRACQHPLLEPAVANSIMLDKKNAFITGSNTSGKSTFLRSIALNAIMAQTICTVSAAKYKAPLFTTLTSINSYDDLSNAKSLYQVEAERLLNILTAADDSRPVLCILDEPLKGTNSPEALCATIEILHYLSQKKVLTLVASHHVQIAHELPLNYAVFHFAAPVSGDPLKQNYILQFGLNYKFNGIDTLDQVGFPSTIVNNARKRMERFLGSETKKE